MDESDRKLLERVAKLSEENNRVLRKLLRSQRWSLFFTVVRWVIVLGIAAGSYYYLLPYLESVFKAYQQISGIGANSVQGFSFGDIQKLFEQYGKVSQ